MKVWTYGEAVDKIAKDMDLEEETFVQTDEMVGYFNDAIDEAESEIQKLGVEDEYFLTSSPLAFVQGTPDVSLPTNIYGTKIRALIYDYNGELYEIARLRRKNKFLQAADTDDSDIYRYLLANDSAAAGYKARIYPTPRETATVGKIWFVRNATNIPLVSAGSLAATRATQLDIPEFMTFLQAFVKVKCMEKESHPDLGEALAERERQRKLMIDTLTEQVVDDNTMIEADLSAYEEMN